MIVRGFVIAICGALLGLGGCFGVVATIESHETLAVVLGITFAIGALAALVGCVLFIAGLIASAQK